VLWNAFLQTFDSKSHTQGTAHLFATCWGRKGRSRGTLYIVLPPDTHRNRQGTELSQANISEALWKPLSMVVDSRW
jgi:hypothetical protein